jgi:hypothetical protein
MTTEELTRWLLDNVRENGGVTFRPRFDCPDGFSVSIQASRYHYCSPRENNQPAYSTVELGFPSEAVEAWLPYAEDEDRPTETVYGYVPLDVVAAALTEHGA